MEIVFSVTEVAAMGRVTPATIRSLIRDGNIEAIRIGRQHRIPERAVNKLFQVDVSRNGNESKDSEM